MQGGKEGHGRDLASDQGFVNWAARVGRACWGWVLELGPAVLSILFRSQVGPLEGKNVHWRWQC